MAEQTLHDYPGFFYHAVEDAQHIEDMIETRLLVQTLARHILARCPHNRERSLALTNLQQASMYAIAALALQGEMVVPEGFRMTLEGQE
jgi:hypothetical protein